MTLYALIAATGQVRETREFAATPPDLMASEGVRWLPIIITDPAFDPATQVRTGPVETILANSVTRVWTVRAKTAQQLDDEKTNRVEGVEFLIFELAFDHENRVRVLEAKAPITRAQFKAALKARLP